MEKIEGERECPKEVVNIQYWTKLFGRKKDPSQSLSKDCQILSDSFSEYFVEYNIRVDSELCLTS